MAPLQETETMSDNPYSSPLSKSESQGGPGQSDKLPGAFITVCVLCLILGIFGLFGTCATGVGFGLQSFMADFLEQAPDTPDMIFQRENLKIQQPLMIPALLMSVVNLFVAGGLVVGSIGSLKRKQSLWSTLRMSLFGAIFYGILKIGLQIYSVFLQQAGFDAMLNDPDLQGRGPELEQLITVGKYMGFGGAAVGVVFAVALIGFYAWAASYLNRPAVRQLYR